MLGAVKDIIPATELGQTGQEQVRERAGSLPAAPGWLWECSGGQGPQEGAHVQGGGRRRLRYQLAQAGSHSGPQAPGGGWFLTGMGHPSHSRVEFVLSRDAGTTS